MPSPTPTTPLAKLNPLDPGALTDPWALYQRAHAEAPIYRHEATGLFLVSGYELVARAARDWETFSNRFAAALGGRGGPPPEVQAVAREGWRPVDTMLTADPPEHHRFRGLVNKAFSLRRVNALEAEIERLADELIDGFAGEGRVEFMTRFAQPLPLTVIAAQLGVPRADLPRLRRWTDGFVAQLGQMADVAGQVEAARLIVEFQHYFARVLEERRAAPKDDIVSDIVHARLEGERPLDVAECLSILQQLLVAGNETTASAIAEGMLLLVRHPDQLERVRADETLLPGLVEEVLRLAAPTANMWRVCTRDTELGGVAIPAGSFLLLRYAAANRDPAVFPEPDRFDVGRANAGEHLAFGRGIHHCLGAMLARKEMAVAFRRLLARLAGWRLAADAPAPRHRPNVLLYGLEALHLEFDV